MVDSLVERLAPKGRSRAAPVNLRVPTNLGAKVRATSVLERHRSQPENPLVLIAGPFKILLKDKIEHD
jgi:hypothetical protein